jgi:hypothetical protein
MDRNINLKSKRNIKLIMIFFISLLVITTCSCGFSTANKPEVSITTAPTGIAAGDVTISVDIANFELLNGGNQNASGQGHIIYYMDVPVPTYYDHSAISKAGTFSVANSASYTWSGVTPGEHTFAVQLVKEDDTPLAAPITDSITANVGPPQGQPALKFASLTDGASLAPGNILIEVTVENFILSKNDMGVVNREGEGHLIYYIDEDPPADLGTPAITETSVVSADTRYLWKNIGEGKHTFAVQLVNNDDTPLESSVVQVISIEVAPQP